MKKNIGSDVLAWWSGLQPPDERTPNRRGDRGALARLRRCASVIDAASEPATFALCRKLGATERDLDRVALLAAVLAQVRDHDGRLRVARQIGVQSRDTPAVMSDLRFRRLLQADTDDEKLIGFRRLVALAGRKLNVADLADGVVNWGLDATRRHWIYAYHDAPDFQPNTADATPSANQDASA
jgi:CRISPR system Cascade subunit CasB